MNNLSYDRLYYYLACLDELRESREDIGLRRARADGLITDLLRELAQLFPEDERILVLAIVGKHEKLWSVSPGMQAKLAGHDGVYPMEYISLLPRKEGQLEYYRLQPLIDAYEVRRSQSPIGSARRVAYAGIANAFGRRVSLPYVVESVHAALGGVEEMLALVPGRIGPNPPNTGKHRSDLLEQKSIYEEFLSFYEGME